MPQAQPLRSTCSSSLWLSWPSQGTRGRVTGRSTSRAGDRGTKVSNDAPVLSESGPEHPEQSLCTHSEQSSASVSSKGPRACGLWTRSWAGSEDSQPCSCTSSSSAPRCHLVPCVILSEPRGEPASSAGTRPRGQWLQLFRCQQETSQSTALTSPAAQDHTGATAAQKHTPDARPRERLCYVSKCTTT